jgi:Bacterial Ig-like domain/Glycosyl hydrolases family 16
MTRLTTIAAARLAPVVKITSQTLARDTGVSATDRITNNGAVSLAGILSAAAGAIIKIYDGATAIGNAMLDRSGGWSFSTVLGPGTHALRAVATDHIGRISQTPPQPTIVVDTSVPTVAFRYESQNAGGNTVLLSGSVSGPTGTTVDVFAGPTRLGQASVTNGNWQFTTPALADGNYSFIAVATTPAGNSSTFSGIPSLTVGSAAGTLDPSRYTTVWRQDFTTSTAIDRSIFPIVYGNADQFAFGANGVTLSSHRAEGFANVGFLQPNWGVNLSQGYGLYSVTASHPANQGGGIAILLWPSNNVWPGAEIDLVENWDDPTSQTAHLSVHFRGPNGKDMANSIRYPVDLTVPNTFALDWQRGSLTFYVNGHQIINITGSEVPRDASDGGVNMAFGAQITDIVASQQPADIVTLTIASMSYSILNTSAATQARNQMAPSPAVAGLLDAMALGSPGFLSQPPAQPTFTERLLDLAKGTDIFPFGHRGG